MRMRSIALALAFFSALSLESFSQAVGAGRNGGVGSGTYTVTGKVMMPDGTAAKTAKIDLTCDFTSLTTYSEENGTYRLTGVPAGNCTVTARAPGGEPVTEHRTITRDTPQGQAIYIPLFLKASPTGQSSLLKDIPGAAMDKFTAGIEKLESRDTSGALSAFDEAIKLHPSFAAAWYQKGSVLLGKNENAKAIEAFVKAIEIKPNYLEAKYGFGLAQFQNENYEVSEAVFRDVVKQKNDMAEAHLNLGISLFYLKRTDEAESELKTVASTKGGEKLALAHLYLGQIYLQKKRNAEAIVELEKYLDLVPKAPNAERIKTVLADLKKQN